MLNPLEKTAIGCWNPTTSKTKSNLFACGTVAGAFDASFSSNTELEIYEHTAQHDQQAMQRLVSLSSPLRFCKLDWSTTASINQYGLLAGGMEGGVVNVWNVDMLLADRGQSKDAAPVYHSQKAHEGMVKGVAFNPVQTNVLATGASSASILVWDMNAPGKTVAPGPKSSKLDDISDLQWNPKVQHILASCSTNGSIVIWDLNQKREAIQMTLPNKYAVSALCWNPDAPTQLFTACEDDAMPVVYGWDLRNAHAPEKSLAGHKKGILCMNWCSKDSELLATAGKDNSVLLWNPRTGERTGQLPSSDNWVFDVRFSPKNPDLLTCSSFDGKINFYSLQEMAQRTSSLFEGSVATSTEVTKIPRWLKRPVGCAFSFSGKLYSFGASSKSVVNFKTVPEDESFFNTVVELENALSSGQMANYCEKRSGSLSSIDATQPIESFWFMLAVGFDFQGKKQKLQKLLGLAREELQERLRKMSLSQTDEDGQSLEESIIQSSFSQQLESTPNSPRLHQPHGESEFSKFITQSLVVGDFESAVSYCRHAGKWADALIIAQCSGSELLQKTQEKYVAHFRNEFPYLPLATSILSNDLSSIIESYPLASWKETLAILCTYASDSQFKQLVSQLGVRLLQSQSYFAAVCCFCCSLDFSNFSKSIYDFLPDILVEDYVQFIATLNYACGNILFTGQSLENREFVLNKLVEYSMIICREGLIAYALKYCQMGQEVSSEDAKIKLFKYRLFTLCSSPEKRLAVEMPFSVVSPYSVEPAQAQQPMQPSQPQYQPSQPQYQPFAQQQPFVQQQQFTQQSFVQQPVQPQYSPYGQSYQSQPSVPIGMQPLTQTFSSAAISQPPPVQMPPPVQSRGAWNDVPFAHAPQQPVRKPLVVTPPQQATPQLPPIGQPPVQQQTPRLQPQMGPPIMQQQQTPRLQPQMGQPSVQMQQTPQFQPQMGPPPVQPQHTPRLQPTGPPPMMQPQQQTPRLQPMPAQMQPPMVQQPHAMAPPMGQPPRPVDQQQRPIGQPPAGQYPMGQPPTVQFTGGQQPIAQSPLPPAAGQGPPVTVPQVSRPPVSQMPMMQPSPPVSQPVPLSQPPLSSQPPVQPTGQPSAPTPSQLPAERPPSVQSVASAKRPSGDISGIPSSLLPIHNSFRSLLDFCKQRAPSSQARLLEDCEKRLTSLFDRMNSDQFSKNPEVINQTLDLARCITERNMEQAMSIQSALYTSHYDEVGTWMISIKRLLELAKKL